MALLKTSLFLQVCRMGLCIICSTRHFPLESHGIVLYTSLHQVLEMVESRKLWAKCSGRLPGDPGESIQPLTCPMFIEILLCDKIKTVNIY